MSKPVTEDVPKELWRLVANKALIRVRNLESIFFWNFFLKNFSNSSVNNATKQFCIKSVFGPDSGK